MKIAQLYDKWKNKLSVQLGVLILGMNLAVLIVCFLVLYMRIEDILLEKDEKDNIERFKQSEYNISSFCEQVEMTLKRLAIDEDVKKLAKGTEMDGDRYYYANRVIEDFKMMQINYPYLEVIRFYGENGIILNVTQEVGGNEFWLDEQKVEPYYSTEIYQDLNSNKKVWYGGYSGTDFSNKNEEEIEDDGYYITAVQVIPFGLGAVVVNIDMNYFLDIFYANSLENSETIYIVDENNIIVAAKDERRIGIENTIEETEKGKIQVTEYQLLALGWKLVSETSVAEVTKESRYLKNILIFSCMFAVVMSFALSMWWVAKMLKPLNELTTVIRKVGDGKLGRTSDKIPKNELGVLTKQFNQMSMDLKELFLQKELVEKERRGLEMQALRAQINPHLIYNTLNTIKWRALINEERNIAESIALLADFLEPVFRKQEQMCTMQEELDYVRNYVKIMNLLKSGGYILHVDVPEKFLTYKIIRFLLQPIVENSIIHGLKRSSSGIINIVMVEEEGNIFITITDNGSGIEAAKLSEIQSKLKNNVYSEGDGVGVINVNRRIKNQYGQTYGITIVNGEEKGTITTLKIKKTE